MMSARRIRARRISARDVRPFVPRRLGGAEFFPLWVGGGDALPLRARGARAGAPRRATLAPDEASRVRAARRERFARTGAAPFGFAIGSLRTKAKRAAWYRNSRGSGFTVRIGS